MQEGSSRLAMHNFVLFLQQKIKPILGVKRLLNRHLTLGHAWIHQAPVHHRQRVEIVKSSDNLGRVEEGGRGVEPASAEMDSVKTFLKHSQNRKTFSSRRRARRHWRRGRACRGSSCPCCSRSGRPRTDDWSPDDVEDDDGDDDDDNHSSFFSQFSIMQSVRKMLVGLPLWESRIRRWILVKHH